MLVGIDFINTRLSTSDSYRLGTRMVFVKFLSPESSTSCCHLAHSKNALSGGKFPLSLLLPINAALPVLSQVKHTSQGAGWAITTTHMLQTNHLHSTDEVSLPGCYSLSDHISSPASLPENNPSAAKGSEEN